ncbi:MAG: type IV-A pilus assembly ATPase PilB [Pseudobdellovibrionaceae bacterium]
MAAAPKLGELLLKEGLVRPEQLQKAIEEQRKSGVRLSQILVQQGLVKEGQIQKTLEKHYQVQGIDLNAFEIDPAVISLVSRDVCEKHLVIPVMKNANILVVAFADPGNMFVRDDLSFVTRMRIRPVVAGESAIVAAIDKYYGSRVKMGSLIQATADATRDEDFEIEEIENIDHMATEDAPIVKLVNAILSEAIRRKASDIHIEPYEKRCRVRYRIDGNLIEASEPPSGAAAALVSRIKIMSKLNIAEKRKPQDGRLKRKTAAGMDIDFRVSTLPTLWGEKVVMRILDRSSLQIDMTKLGFEPEDLILFKQVIAQPQGMVLITGPTGSGKTVTIYSALQELNKPDVNISTAEDPVEFNFEGINQVQMNPDAELTFASALRAFLRQDPDIVMVGEVRDLETAEIAIKAASTGHLVVSTLHTNDAPATIMRLTDMGIPPYVVTSTLNLVVAQRLCGKICESCKTQIEVKPEVLIDLGVDPSELRDYRVMQGRGCNICGGTGIKGRVAIFELMVMSSEIKEAIIGGASESLLRRTAKEQGMKTLRRSALLKLKRGLLSIQEVVNNSVKDT